MCDDWGTYLGDCHECGNALYNTPMSEAVLDLELDFYFCDAECRGQFYNDPRFRATFVDADLEVPQ